MTRTLMPITLTLDRGILEHPQGLHIRRMRSAVWLYLTLLARLPADTLELDVDIPRIAQDLGLPEGTIRSWLGHLRKHRYVRVRRLGDSLRISVRRVPHEGATKPAEQPARLFSAAKLEAALGETGHRDGIEAALDTYDDSALQKSLAAALAVPANEIRRSRTALFLYLLKRYAYETPTHDPRS